MGFGVRRDLIEGCAVLQLAEDDAQRNVIVNDGQVGDQPVDNTLPAEGNVHCGTPRAVTQGQVGSAMDLVRAEPGEGIMEHDPFTMSVHGLSCCHVGLITSAFDSRAKRPPTTSVDPRDIGYRLRKGRQHVDLLIDDITSPLPARFDGSTIRKKNHIEAQAQGAMLDLQEFENPIPSRLYGTDTSADVPE